MQTKDKVDNAVKLGKELVAMMEDIANDVIIANQQSMAIHLGCGHSYTEKRECQTIAPYVDQYNRETGTFCRDCNKKMYSLRLSSINRYYMFTWEEYEFVRTAIKSALSTIEVSVRI